DLILEDLRSKLDKGDIDKKLEKILADANLTPDQAKQLLKDADRVKAAKAGRTVGPNKSLQDLRTGATLNRDARHQPPPELERAYRKFTEERAKQSQGEQPKRQ